MIIQARLNSIDKDQVELFEKRWLMGAVHLDHFSSIDGVTERLENDETVLMELSVLDKEVACLTDGQI
jgi:hypothetical protein